MYNYQEVTFKAFIDEAKKKGTSALNTVLNSVDEDGRTILDYINEEIENEGSSEALENMKDYVQKHGGKSATQMA